MLALDKRWDYPGRVQPQKSGHPQVQNDFFQNTFIPASEASCGIGSRGWDLAWDIRYLLPGGCTGKGLRHEARSRSIRRTSSTRLEVG